MRLLESHGFSIVRIRGSDDVMARQEASPVHGSQTLKIGTLRGILRDIDISPQDFARLWKP